MDGNYKKLRESRNKTAMTRYRVEPEETDVSAEVRELCRKYMPDFPVRHCGTVHADTTELMDIGYGAVMLLDGLHYMVMKDESERRFGMEDPKFWVKRCRVMETGERKIVKLVFHENFLMKIGNFELRCFRSPEKEARILNLVRGDARFMQGLPVHDAAGNVARILDIVRGKRLDLIVRDIEADHETYFHEHLPEILEKFAGACEAIRFLHTHREKHGDIRRDHLWVEHGTGNYVWIDFDYAFDFHENPFGLDLFGLGNILLFLVGKGEHTVKSLGESESGRKIIGSLTPDDYSLFFKYRVMNLRKLFPYIPKELNHVLMHFSAGSMVFYETVDELLEELTPCCKLVGR